MKRILFSFLLVIMITACAAQSSTPEAQTAVEVAPTQTPEATEASPQALTASQNTPSTDSINAPEVSSPSIFDIHMLDEDHGWGLTEKNIIRTLDGGATWYNVTPPGLTDAGYFVSTDFFDVTHAWIQFPDQNNYPNAGTMYRTSDGGATWDSFTTPFSGGRFYFIDENNGWMMADLGVGAGSMAISVFQTTNGGASWNRVFTNDPNIDGSSDTLPLGGLKQVLRPLNMDTAWVGGVVYAPGTVYLFRSDDSGKTWSTINLTLPNGMSESELSVEKLIFVSPEKGVMMIRANADTINTLLYATKDGGNTWTQIPQTFQSAGFLEIPSASEMVFYGEGKFYVTNDAGDTWNTVQPNVDFTDIIVAMNFVSSKVGWVITADASDNRTLYKTEDGGATWLAIAP